MTKYNVDLMLAVREQITSHPETHDQAIYASQTECSTTYCIAGWAAVLAGERMHWEGVEAYVIERPTEDGAWISIRSAARDHLGISDADASDLFSGSLARPEALAMLDELIEKGKNES